MKYVFSFLFFVIICSCSIPKKDIQPPAEYALSSIPRTIIETDHENASVEDDTTQYYSYSYNRDYDVIYYDASDLTFLLVDKSIRALSLYGGTYQDLSPLSMLQELEELSIMSNDYIINISPIASLINLKKLRLISNVMIESIAPISALTNLRHLEIFHDDGYYEELIPLQQLEYLLLMGYNRLDTSYIAQLHSLKELYIDCGPITNIELLKNLVNLEKLFINSGGFDISWITHLQNLKELELRVNRIDDISPLLELPNLVDVSLYKTVVRDIRPLSESRSIKRITGFVLESSTGELDLNSVFWERGIEYIPYFSDR
jgi:Leucine-rich repeat (LRR) protein